MTLPGETIGRSLVTELPAGSTCTCVDCGKAMPIAVLSSAAGYYVGFFCPSCGPYSRESQYFRKREEAQEALEHGTWTPR